MEKCLFCSIETVKKAIKNKLSPEIVIKIHKIKGKIFPERSQRKRNKLTKKYLRGDGLEIGAYNNPAALKNAKVKYVDRVPDAGLEAGFKTMNSIERIRDPVYIDILDDGEQLLTIPSHEQYDFIVANHFLEHCEDPTGTIKCHLSKIRRGGILFYAIPDMRYTFDKEREITSLNHFINDYKKGKGYLKREHVIDFVSKKTQKNGRKLNDGKIEIRVNEILEINRPIHYHTWTFESLKNFALYLFNNMRAFSTYIVIRNRAENVLVIWK